jgi:UDP-N-acetylglucosamine transferase subunit ALG13
MIFVTTGTQTPFNRLLRAVDAWALSRKCPDVFAQIGRDAWKPIHIPHAELLDPGEYQRLIARCTLVVSHAGMGTILTAMRYGKPLLIMPKRAALGEHRNEHQSATARRLSTLGIVHVAWNEEELYDCLDRHHELNRPQTIGPHASPRLIGTLRDFIHGI